MNKDPILRLYPYKYDKKSEQWMMDKFDTMDLEDVAAKLPIDEKEVKYDGNNDEVVDEGNDEKEKQENDIKDIDEQKLKQLIVMSFNVWFGRYKFKVRQNKLVDILKDIKPDILCFQEVTEEWVENIVQVPFIRNNYGITDNPSNLTTLDPYGVFIGVNIHKFDIEDLRICELETRMERKLLSTKLKLKSTGQILWINTVHLESENHNANIRIIQLQTIDKYMAAMKQFDHKSTVMLMGDFNFRDNSDKNYFEENDYLKEDQFSDCWRQYAKDNNVEIESGWTRRVGYRYDRILMNISSKWNVTDFKILGNTESKMPSDHKGVVVYLE